MSRPSSSGTEHPSTVALVLAACALQLLALPVLSIPAAASGVGAGLGWIGDPLLWPLIAALLLGPLLAVIAGLLAVASIIVALTLVQDVRRGRRSRAPVTAALAVSGLVLVTAIASTVIVPVLTAV